MTTFTQATPSSPVQHAPASATSKQFSPSSGADSTLDMSSHNRFNKPLLTRNIKDEISQSADSVGRTIASPNYRNPGPVVVSKWLNYTRYQMDISRVSPYRRKVAGHGPHSHNDPVVMLSDRGDHCIYKQTQRLHKGLNEVCFYEKLWADELRASAASQGTSGAQSDDGGEVNERQSERVRESAPLSAALMRFRRWVPRYYGLFAISAERLAAICAGSPSKSFPCARLTSHETLYFLKLEDTLGRLRWPSVIDLKMGRVTYDRLASAEDRRKKITRYMFRKEVGFSFSGMHVFDWSTHKYILYERHIGRLLSVDDILNMALNEFLPLSGSSPGRDPRAIREEPSDDQLLDGVRESADANKCTGEAEGESKGFVSGVWGNEAEAAELRALRRALVRRFLVKLRALLADYEQQREQHIIASSILLAYDYIAPAERAAACRALDALSDAGDDGFCNPNSCSSSNMSCPTRSLPRIPPVGPNSINSDPQTSGQCVPTCTETATPGTKSLTAEVTDVVVRMIDFAHVEVPEPPGSPDVNVLYGMRNLIRYFETLLES